MLLYSKGTIYPCWCSSTCERAPLKCRCIVQDKIHPYRCSSTCKRAPLFEHIRNKKGGAVLLFRLPIRNKQTITKQIESAKLKESANSGNPEPVHHLPKFLAQTNSSGLRFVLSVISAKIEISAYQQCYDELSAASSLSFLTVS